MVHVRILAFAGLCALSAPTAALAQEASALPTVMGGGPDMEVPSWVNFPIDTSVRQAVGDGCVYEASARGSYRAAPGGNVPDSDARDAHIEGYSRLTCNGRELVHATAHVVSGMASTTDIARRVRDQLAIEVPASGCAVAPTITLGGTLLPGQSSGSCEHAAVASRSVAPVTASPRGGGPQPGGYWRFRLVERHIARDRRLLLDGIQQGGAPTARGGGPGFYGDRPVTSEDARLGVL